MINRKRIYAKIVDALSEGSLTREALIDEAVSALGGPGERCCPIGPRTKLRGEVGAVISEMEDSGVIRREGAELSLLASRPVALRAESCEKELLNLLMSGGPLSKRDIRDSLVRHFGTDKTPSTRDDQILFSLIGQVIKRLMNRGVILLEGGLYTAAPEIAARRDDVSRLLALKSELLSRIHSKGGEFFEHYIMTLLKKYFSKCGKTVTECYVTGGSADGGIDGVIKTEDALGFREELMIQAKNRLELTTETAVRSFYGAVCAAQGSRGIFATTSDFHPSAAKFLEGIDNCVGVNADIIFKLACECEYGVKRRDGKYTVDTKIL